MRRSRQPGGAREPGGAHGSRGAEAERYAADALRRDGYRILLRNHKTPVGELDIVALRRGVFTFVEVKARRRLGRAGTPEQALTPTKLKRVARAAEHVLKSRGLPNAPHVLLGAAVDLDPDGQPESVRFLPVESV